MKTCPVLLALALVLGAPVLRAEAEPIIGLTTADQLFTFDSATPGAVSALTPVTGLVGTLVGIDIRTVDGQLVGVGNLGGVGTVYSINLTTGVATAINTGFALTGSVFDIDFNPVDNTLRIVSGTGQNLRILNGGAGAVNVDAPLNPGTPSVVGAAYSDNFAGATSTTLYDIDIDSQEPELILQTQGSLGGNPLSADSGTLFPVGPLGISTGDPSSNPVGFDISGATGTAFASRPTTFYTINLSTGTATLVGTIGTPGAFIVEDIAVQAGAAQVIPEPGSITLLSLGAVGLAGYQWRRRKLARGADERAEARRPALSDDSALS